MGIIERGYESAATRAGSPAMEKNLPDREKFNFFLDKRSLNH
ncbi:MAG: hypothetical protein ACE5OR_07025 [bacterium]